jgi:hypothetical protein
MQTKKSDSSDFSCLSDHSATTLVTDFSSNVATYRSLAGIDSQKVLDGLDSAIAGAEKSLSDKSFSSVLDGLISIPDAPSKISDAYGSAKATS